MNLNRPSIGMQNRTGNCNIATIESAECLKAWGIEGFSQSQREEAYRELFGHPVIGLTLQNLFARALESPAIPSQATRRGLQHRQIPS